MGDPVSTPPSKTQHIVVTALTLLVMVALFVLLVVTPIVLLLRWLF